MYKIKASEFLPRKLNEEEYTGFATKEEAKAKVDEMVDKVLEHIRKSSNANNDFNYFADVSYDVETDESSVTVRDYSTDIVYMYLIIQE